MRICLDKFAERTHIDDAEIGEIYFCPECGEKMVQRHGEIRIPHFAHYPNTHCNDLWHYDESDWHTKLQSLFPKENQEIVKELDGKKHRVDVLFEDRKTVIEIQGDRLNQEEFEQRNIFFNSLGYKVIWLFNASIPFANSSIEWGHRIREGTRKWNRPSRTFKGFDPEECKGKVEVWFQRSESENDDEPRFFQVFSSDNSLKTMDCSFCHSLNELFKYLAEGKRMPNYSKLLDVKYGIRRTNDSDSIYYCPRKTRPGFQAISECDQCSYMVEQDVISKLRYVGCTYRFENTKWEAGSEICEISRRADGLIESVSIKKVDGETDLVRFDCPNPFLRPLPVLWSIYNPLRRFMVFNTKDHKLYCVYGVKQQKLSNGVIKGSVVNSRGIPHSSEVVLTDAEEPIWFVVSFS